MYRSLIGNYLTTAALILQERQRTRNVFSIALGPHGSTLNDVVKALVYITSIERFMLYLKEFDLYTRAITTETLFTVYVQEENFLSTVLKPALHLF